MTIGTQSYGRITARVKLSVRVILARVAIIVAQIIATLMTRMATGTITSFFSFTVMTFTAVATTS